MNDIMLDIIGLADEEFLLEAQSAKKAKRRFSVGFIAAAAAAAVMTVTAGAAIGSLMHRASVEYYHNEIMTSQIEEGGYVLGQVTENEHLRLTLEYLLVDENYAYGVVTAEYLDGAGREAFENKSLMMLDEDGRNLQSRAQGGEIIRAVFGRGIIGNGTPDRQAYLMELDLRDPFLAKRTQLPDKLKIIFVEDEKLPLGTDAVLKESDLPGGGVLEGLSFEVSLRPNTESVYLASDSGHRAYISEFMYDIQYSDLDGTFADNREFPDTLTLNYRDGTKKTLKYSRTSPRTSDMKHEGGHLDDNRENCDVHGTFNSLIGLEGLESAEYAGETYKVM